MRLLDFWHNVNSQNGEDGILGKIMETLPALNRWCVEFGAWDGRYLSNTCLLIEKSGFSAVLIEPDKEKFSGIVRNHPDGARVYPLNRFVGFTAEDNLAHLIREVPIPKDFDLLSIDIEGNDYHAWDALQDYLPKVVHISYNPSIPSEVEFVQPKDPNVNQGASLLSLAKLGKQKGYELVCANHNAAFFVRAEFFPLFGIENNSVSALREDTSDVTHLFCGYDGKIFVQGRNLLAHHRGIRIEKRISQLPRYFRVYPARFSPIQDWSYRFYWRIMRLIGRG